MTRRTAVFVATLSIAVPTLASAEPTDPFATTLSLGGGVNRFSAEEFTSRYGNGPNVVELGIGKRVSRFFELGASGAYGRVSGNGTPLVIPLLHPIAPPKPGVQPDKGVNHRVDLETPSRADGVQILPADRLQMKVWAASATGKLRLDFRPEQGVVPYLGAGVMYLNCSERADRRPGERGTDTAYGAIFMAGVELRLDAAEPDRASTLQANYGIDDTFLAVGVEKTQIDNFGGGAPVDLSGWRGIVGLKFAF